MRHNSIHPHHHHTSQCRWDSTLNAVLWSLLDPETYIWASTQWFNMGIHSHYAIDYVSGNAVGPWFVMSHSAVRLPRLQFVLDVPCDHIVCVGFRNRFSHFPPSCLLP